MGVPGLFSWVQRKFPKTVSEKTVEHKNQFPDDTCDHLYIDLNHILHSCAHSLGLPPGDGPLQGIFDHIADYVDWVMNVAKPERLCLLAIDGVAPKAKLNQQRTRRFLGAHRSKLGKEIGKRLRGEMETNAGKTFPDPRTFDQNIITPGTPFMRELTQLLQDYIDQRLRENAKWKNLKVILSTANEPGEGEHKIMKFVRDQRHRQGYDPKTRHVIFGQDADLILLSLLTHEPHVRILRERLAGIGEPPPGKLPDFNELDIGMLRQYFKFGLDPYRPPPKEPEEEESHSNNGASIPDDEQALSEAKGQEDTHEPVRDFVFERTLEDFVLLTFLLGNDFLPSVPSIDVYDHFGGLDRLVDSYKKVRNNGRDFLTKEGTVNIKVFHEVLKHMVEDEHDAYRRIRNQRENHKKRLLKQDEGRLEGEGVPQRGGNAFEEEGYISCGSLPPGLSVDDALKGKWAKLEEKEKTVGGDLSMLSEEELSIEFKNRLANRIDMLLLADCDADPTRLGSHGYEERYYVDIHVAKYGGESSNRALEMGKEYVQGLCWSFAYYTVGTNPVATTEDSLLTHRSKKKTTSKEDKERPNPLPKTQYAVWDWCYGYHHAPLIKDLARACREAALKDVLRPGAIHKAATGLSVNQGPVPPLVQLLSVLPPESADACLPFDLARLLKAVRQDSEGHRQVAKSVKRIVRMFPDDLGRRIDSRGKTWAHTVVVRLPIVDYSELTMAAIEAIQNRELTEEEEEGNSFNCSDLYLRQELCAKWKAKADAVAARLDAAQGKKAEKAELDWGDSIVDDDVRPEPILDLVIPPFDTLVEDEEEEETVCLGCDIAGITSTPTPCALLPGALDTEPALEGHQFIIKPRPPVEHPTSRDHEKHQWRRPRRGKPRPA